MFKPSCWLIYFNLKLDMCYVCSPGLIISYYYASMYVLVQLSSIYEVIYPIQPVFFCAIVSHPADTVVSKLNQEEGATFVGVAKNLGWSG